MHKRRSLSAYEPSVSSSSRVSLFFHHVNIFFQVSKTCHPPASPHILSNPYFLWSAIRCWVFPPLSCPSFPVHSLSPPVSLPFHSCPHILGSPVLRSRISLWNLVHLFPSIQGRRWRNERNTQGKYRQTQSGITRDPKRGGYIEKKARWER